MTPPVAAGRLGSTLVSRRARPRHRQAVPEAAPQRRMSRLLCPYSAAGEASSLTQLPAT